MKESSITNKDIMKAPSSSNHATPRTKKGLGLSFNLLWGGQTISAFGSQVTILALPLLAIYQLHASDFAVGVLSALSFLPYLLLGLQAGVYVDRLSKRVVMLVCDILRAIFLIMLPVSALLGHLTLWLLFLVAFVNGCCTVFFEVAYVSYLPEIVTSEQLPEGNAKLEFSRGASQVGGPSLGGSLVQIFGASTAVIIDSTSYIASFLSLILLPKDNRQPEKKVKKSFWDDIVEGFVFISHHQLLRSIILSYSLNAFFIGLYQAVSIVYMTRTLHIGAATIGLIATLGNCGFLLGAAASRYLARKIGIGRVIVGALGVIAVGFLITGLALTTFAIPWLVSGQLITSFGVPLYNINMVSLRQGITPQPLLGRVSSVSRVVGRGIVPVGALLGASIATFSNPRTAVIVAGIGGILAILPAILSKTIKVKSLQDVIADQNIA